MQTFREKVEEHLQRIAVMELGESLVPPFIQSELTLFIIQRRKFQERTAFAPRKGFEMLCKFKEASK